MLGTIINEQFKNVNTPKGIDKKYVSIPEVDRVEYINYNYHIENNSGNRRVVAEKNTHNQKKLDNLTVSRILDSLYVSNPSNIRFDKTIKNDAEKVRSCGVKSVVEINGEMIETVGNTCGKRFCPSCTAKKAKEAAAEMEQIIDLAFCKKEDAFKENCFGKPLKKKKDVKRIRGEYYTGRHKPSMGFVTLTVPNCKLEELSETITYMMNAWNILSRTYEFTKAIDGGMRALEVTFNPDTMTFHPHFHILLVGKQRVSLKKWYIQCGLATHEKNNYVAEKAWLDRWQSALDKAGYDKKVSMNGIDVQYISKKIDYTKEEERIAFCIEQSQEIAKYVMKYSDILALTKETYQNTKYDTGVYDDGTRFKNARGQFNEVKDKEVQNEDWSKACTAFWYTMTALFDRQCHSYFGCLSQIRRQLREERAELADSGKMNQANSKDTRTRVITDFEGEILVDNTGRQVWDMNKAKSVLKIEKQDKPVIALKIFKQKPDINGNREAFYVVASPEFEATRFNFSKNLQKNITGRKEQILHNIHYATFNHK
jgi:plasmid rolling circle replication initiator protein Rep